MKSLDTNPISSNFHEYFSQKVHGKREMVVAVKSRHFLNETPDTLFKKLSSQ